MFYLNFSKCFVILIFTKLKPEEKNFEFSAAFVIGLERFFLVYRQLHKHFLAYIFLISSSSNTVCGFICLSLLVKYEGNCFTCQNFCHVCLFGWNCSIGLMTSFSSFNISFKSLDCFFWVVLLSFVFWMKKEDRKLFLSGFQTTLRHKVELCANTIFLHCTLLQDSAAKALS